MELSLSRIGRRHNRIYNHFWLIHVSRQRDWSENFWFTLQLYDLHFLSSLFNPDTCFLFWSIGSDDMKFVYEVKKKKRKEKLNIVHWAFADVSFQYEREEWAAFNPDLDTVTSFWGGPGETLWSKRQIKDPVLLGCLSDTLTELRSAVRTAI